MADPYAAMAEHYDIMIDWPARLQREREFITRLFGDQPPRRVLDVGCGTGHHTRMFAELGAVTTGMDPSVPMLERAQSLTPGDNPTFVAGGFADIPTLHNTFDLIAVLGNTLAYVKDFADLSATVLAMRRALNPQARLVIQVVNYDKLQNEGSRWLPTVHRQAQGREFLFLREYRLVNRMVEFTLIALQRDGEWRQHVERSRHYPITAPRLERALSRANFHRIILYGDFKGAPFDPNTSPGLIAIAE